jgi:hypothetical protein
MVKKKVYITRKPVLGNSHILSRHNNKYTKYFPSLIDPHFNHKISKHNVFKRYKLKRNTQKIEALYKAFETNIPMVDSKKSGNIRILKPTQKMLRNFMSSYSPYRSLLIYHEMGVGKTCTAITIAEELKKIVEDSNKKIYVLRWQEIARQIFDINMIAKGEPLKQCTGDTYIQDPKLEPLVDACSSGNKDMCDQLETKVNKIIKKTYKFMGTKSWARSVESIIKTKTNNIHDEKEKEKRTREIICEMFDNAVIIIDEAHELRDNNKTDSKIVTPVLKMVVEYSNNLRLIMLSATPIFDEPQNIISLLNYMLLNDKRKPISENSVFTKDGELKPEGRDILIKNSRGYISFLRGNNPFDFPIRISAKYNIPDKILNLSKYPKRDIYGKQINTTDKIKHLELVDCPLESYQKEVMLFHIKHDEIPYIEPNDLDKITFDALNNNLPVPNRQSDSKQRDSKQSNSSNASLNSEVKIDNNGNIKSGSNPLIDRTRRELTLLDKKNLEKLINKDVDEASNSKTYLSDASLVEKVENVSETIELRDKIKLDDDVIEEQTVAYQTETQMSNFIYQSLKEANDNVKLTFGNLGLSQVATLNHGTYRFNNPEYAKRFKINELKKWGIKIANAVERIIASSGPVFVYTFYHASGILPLAFALEMNGFKRYRQHSKPLVESQYKDSTDRGDYIIYSGEASLSQYATEYLDMKQNMVNEKRVRVLIGSKKASEGLNLFGYREVHIIEPWHNINQIEQSIGRAIRTGSHLHLPPQERNVTVYQYASTLPDIESSDLRIYKLCENKAIKAGAVEKLLKENAFDCKLNESENVYDNEHYSKKIPIITSNGKKIMVSLADEPYSRACSYQESCTFKCIAPSEKGGEGVMQPEIPLMKFNYEKDAYEYKNLIIELMKTNYNVNIKSLRDYLRKYVNDNIENPDDDDEIFELAIQELINMDTVMIDKSSKKGRSGKIVLSGDNLRFIPDGNLDPNMSIQKQHMKRIDLVQNVDLKDYITRLKDEQSKIIGEETFVYSDILNKHLIEKAEHIFYGTGMREFKYNVKMKLDDIICIIYDKLIYGYKLTILKTLLDKIIKGVRLTESDKRIEVAIKNNIVYYSDIFPDRKKGDDTRENIYGFIILNDNKLELYSAIPGGGFENNSGNLGKFKEFRKYQLNKYPANKLYGYLKYEKGDAQFKITDIETKGEKKSVTGITCKTKNTKDIKKKIRALDSKVILQPGFVDIKNVLCNDVEALLRRNDAQHINGKKWYYSPEDYYIYFGGH